MGLYRDQRGHWHLDLTRKGQRLRRRYGAVSYEAAARRAQADAFAFQVQVLALPPVLTALVSAWPARFLAKVQVDATGCWLWTGWLDRDGYGRFRGRGAHTFAYKHIHGPLPPDHEPDHICRARACVNPDHLEAVSHEVNVRRGLAGHSRARVMRPA
jgi:hypothetical protein